MLRFPCCLDHLNVVREVHRDMWAEQLRVETAARLLPVLRMLRGKRFGRECRGAPSARLGDPGRPRGARRPSALLEHHHRILALPPVRRTWCIVSTATSTRRGSGCSCCSCSCSCGTRTRTRPRVEVLVAVPTVLGSMVRMVMMQVVHNTHDGAHSPTRQPSCPIHTLCQP